VMSKEIKLGCALYNTPFGHEFHYCLLILTIQQS
jgi:hypothetical protein